MQGHYYGRGDIVPVVAEQEHLLLSLQATAPHPIVRRQVP